MQSTVTQCDGADALSHINYDFFYIYFLSNMLLLLNGLRTIITPSPNS